MHGRSMTSLVVPPTPSLAADPAVPSKSPALQAEPTGMFGSLCAPVSPVDAWLAAAWDWENERCVLLAPTSLGNNQLILCALHHPGGGGGVQIVKEGILQGGPVARAGVGGSTQQEERAPWRVHLKRLQ